MNLGKFKDYMMLARIDSQASMVLPLTSALVTLNLAEASPPLGIVLHFLALFAMALSYNTLGFILNDYVDVEIDRLGGYLSEKPLVKGTISKREALVFAVGAALAASLFACLITEGDPTKLIIFALSIALGLIYDFHGKKFVGSDVFLAGSISTFCLFNALATSPAITLTNLPPLIYVICALFFLQVLYNDTVHGGVKNVDHDQLGGARTLAVALGVKLEDRDLKMSLRFIAYGLTTKIIYVALLLYAFVAFDLNSSIMIIVDGRTTNTQILLLMAPLLIGVFFTTTRYLSVDRWDRKKLFRIRNFNEYCTYSLIPMMSLSIIGLEGALFLMLIPVVLPFIMRFLLSGRTGLFTPRGHE